MKEETIKDGPQETFYENGQLKSRYNYKDDELDGPHENFHENGQLQWRMYTKDGKLVK